MWALLPLAVLLGDYFCPRGGVFGGEGIVGGWEGLRTEFGQGFPCLGEFFPVAMLLGCPFGYFGVGLIVRGVWGEWKDLRSKFGQVFPCLGAFCV